MAAKSNLFARLQWLPHTLWQPFYFLWWVNNLYINTLGVCAGLEPSQSEIFYVIVACSVYWPFKTSTPPKVKYFLVIVASSVYCNFFCILAFQVWHTLPKWNIFCYCSIFCILAFQDQQPSQSEIFSCYCSFFCILAFQYLPKWNIFLLL